MLLSLKFNYSTGRFFSQQKNNLLLYKTMIGVIPLSIPSVFYRNAFFIIISRNAICFPSLLGETSSEE